MVLTGLAAWPSLVYVTTINIPTIFSIGSTSCQSPITNLYCSFFAPTNTLTITMSNSSNLPLTINFTILSLLNPNVTTPQYFSITTLDSNNYQIQTDSTTVVFSNNCTLPCRTCLPNGTNTCLTCYGLTISNYTLLYNTQCLSQCPNSTYQINSTCITCDISCLTCSFGSTNCTSCNVTSDSY